MIIHKSGEWVDGVIAPSYGSVGSMLLQRAHGGKYYNASEDSRDNRPPVPPAENSNSNDRKPEVKTPEDFGFRDWKND